MAKDKNKDTEINERILQIRKKFFNNSNRDFANNVGINENYLGKICHFDIGVGKKITDKIIEAMPEISPSWLLLGIGSMVRGESSTANDLGRESLEEEVRRLEEIVTKQAEQIDRLLKIIESITNPSSNNVQV